MNQRIHMFDRAKKLWPLNRSLSGEGVRETLAHISSELPSLTLKSFNSGDKAFDWTFPKEWNVRAATLTDPSGKTICDFAENNLRLVGYSIPFKGTVSLEELQEHLFSLPNQSDAIPYVTSYYKENWGFCLTQQERETLNEGNYQVDIDSSLTDGKLDYAELVIPGSNDREVVFSTYICHPSMANNELSGPVLAVELAKYLQEKQNYWTYRFLFLPETIGSLGYISENLEHLKSKTLAGYVLTCVGDERQYSFLPSRNGSTVADRFAVRALRELGLEFESYSWLDRGSDERQYCAPGVDLPFCSLMRSKYGAYPEYHTSLDRLGVVVTECGLQGSFDLYSKVIKLFEANRFPFCTQLGEPQLGKRGLYPNTSIKRGANFARNIVNVLSVADGTLSVAEIAHFVKAGFVEVQNIVSLLEKEGLLSH